MTNETVLVVEDEPVVAAIVVDVLRARLFRVLTANDRRSAIERVQENTGKVDLVLLDIMLPGCDGFDLARELMQLAPRAMIVPMTALEKVDVEPFFQQMDIRTFLYKPFTVADLDAVLREAFGIRPTGTRSGGGTP